MNDFKLRFKNHFLPSEEYKHHIVTTKQGVRYPLKANKDNIKTKLKVWLFENTMQDWIRARIQQAKLKSLVGQWNAEVGELKAWMRNREYLLESYESRFNPATWLPK